MAKTTFYVTGTKRVEEKVDGKKTIVTKHVILRNAGDTYAEATTNAEVWSRREKVGNVQVHKNLAVRTQNTSRLHKNPNLDKSKANKPRKTKKVQVPNRELTPQFFQKMDWMDFHNHRHLQGQAQ